MLSSILSRFRTHTKGFADCMSRPRYWTCAIGVPLLDALVDAGRGKCYSSHIIITGNQRNEGDSHPHCQQYSDLAATKTVARIHQT